MKRLATISIILTSAFCAYAQNVDKTVTLDEVTVKAAKVVNKPDGMLIYPTDAQKQASNNGYSILEKLTLANIRIDNINHTITAIDNRGSVQLRVNGIVVGKQEICDQLWPKKPDASDTLYTLIRRIKPIIEVHSSLKIESDRGKSYSLRIK